MILQRLGAPWTRIKVFLLLVSLLNKLHQRSFGTVVFSGGLSQIVQIRVKICNSKCKHQASPHGKCRSRFWLCVVEGYF